MSRKRKELPTLEGVKITDVAAEGNALARVDDMVVFIPFGARAMWPTSSSTARRSHMPRGI